MNLDNVLICDRFLGAKFISFSYAKESPELLPDKNSNYLALGGLFYELATQKKPIRFEDDSIEAIFQGQEIPLTIQHIIQKLLSKFPKNRYQSLDGLISDLKSCMVQFQKTASIQYFFHGQKDLKTSSLLTEYLYRRSSEEDFLSQAVSNLPDRKASFIYVEGGAGVGKTALVENELRNGLFENVGRGKCDQFQNRPYAVLVEAMKSLIAGTDSDSFQKISKALPQHEKYLTIMLSDGSDFENRSLDEEDAVKEKLRLHNAFVDGIGYLSDEVGSLALFLDDVQWSDKPTLDVLASLSIYKFSNRILIFRAHRPVEGGPFDHILSKFKSDVSEIDVLNCGLLLKNLTLNSVKDLVSDVIGLQDSDSLGSLIFSKNGGNSLFVRAC